MAPQFDLEGQDQPSLSAELTRPPPYVVEFERVVGTDTTLVDITETYQDVLDRYGILHLKGLALKVMGQAAFDTYRPELMWGKWEGARVETVTAAFPVKVEESLSIKAWKKRQFKAMKGLSTEVLQDPVKSYWATINASLGDHFPSLAAHAQGVPLVPPTFHPVYGMIMERSASKPTEAEANLGDGGQRYARDHDFPSHWNQHHPDFGGRKNGLYHHPALEEHKLLGIASPFSYFYAGSFLTSFQHHWEDFWMPSVNAHYWGAEKLWMSASPSDTRQVWEVIKWVGKHLGKAPEEKKFLLSPELLEELGGVVTYPVHQLPGDMVVSGAGASHGGLNLGLNYAEAVNFVDGDWVSKVDSMIDFYTDRDKGIPRCITEIAESYSLPQ